MILKGSKCQRGVLPRLLNLNYIDLLVLTQKILQLQMVILRDTPED